MAEAAEFQAAVQQLETAYREALHAFAKWYATEWQLTPERWAKDFADPVPSDEWFKGHNVGVEGVLVGLDCFLDEHLP